MTILPACTALSRHSFEGEAIHPIFLSRATPVRKAAEKDGAKLGVERLTRSRTRIAVHLDKSFSCCQPQPVGLKNCSQSPMLERRKYRVGVAMDCRLPVALG